MVEGETRIPRNTPPLPELPEVEVTRRGFADRITGAAITAPLFKLSASGTAQNYGGASLLAPSPRLGAQAQAWLIAPGATLTAAGTAVVTATYEAYALNLNHPPAQRGIPEIDELTRYTNFPFTHIVRYQNSYYGANSTGLYLLEGTTDDGALIEVVVGVEGLLAPLWKRLLRRSLGNAARSSVTGLLAHLDAA